MNILVIDVGGSNVKIFTSDEKERRKFPSGAALTAAQMVEEVKVLASDWTYDVVSIGYPGKVKHERIVAEPHNLGSGWLDFDFSSAFDCPVKLINDAAMQALGNYRGGSLLFLGFGTGLGSAMIVDGTIVPMELGHLPYKRKTFEDYVGASALQRVGVSRWRADVFDVIAKLSDALVPDEVLLGGGKVKKLDALPPGCRRGANADAFTGGIRLWTGGPPGQDQ
ncbi:MAG: ROK family protein [Gammaproteobacteria bacterium]|nr:ROK family protein [Gammaproteobacteria bacterium]